MGQAIIIASSPLIARLYPPADFGVLAVYTSMLSILLVLASLRYEMAIPLPDNDATAGALMVLCFGILTGMTVLVALGVHFFGNAFVLAVNSPTLRPYLWLLPIGVAGAGAYQILNYWAVRKKAFRSIARTRLSQSIGKVITQVVLWWVGFGTVGLLLADEVGRASGIGSLAIAAHESRVEWRLALNRIGEGARRYIKFPLITTWAGLLNVASLQLPALLLSAQFGSETTGYYSLGYRLLGAPTSLIGLAVGQVLFASAAELANEHEKIRSITEQSALVLFAVGLPIFGTIGLLGRMIFSVAFGREWVTAGYYAQWLAPWFLFWLVSSPLSNLLSVREWQGSALAFTVGEFSLRFVSVMIGAWRHSAVLAIILLSCSGVVISLLSIVRFLHAGYSGPTRLLKPLGRIAALGVLCLCPLLLAGEYLSIPLVVITTAASLAAYYLVLFRLSPFKVAPRDTPIE